MKKSDINKAFECINTFVQECPSSDAIKFLQCEFTSWLHSKEGEMDREIDKLNFARSLYYLVKEKSPSIDFGKYLDEKIRKLDEE